MKRVKRSNDERKMMLVGNTNDKRGGDFATSGNGGVCADSVSTYIPTCMHSAELYIQDSLSPWKLESVKELRQVTRMCQEYLLLSPKYPVPGGQSARPITRGIDRLRQYQFPVLLRHLIMISCHSKKHEYLQLPFRLFMKRLQPLLR